MSKKKRMKNRMTRAERQKLMRKRRRKRIALLVTEVLILAALCVTAYGIFKLDKLDFNILNDKNLEAYKDTGPYTNIACSAWIPETTNWTAGYRATVL